MIHAVILAGGAGKRFWPQSRRATPKQLLRIAGEATMIEETAVRLKGLVPPERVHVVTGASTAKAMKRFLPKADVVAEPVGRDTTAAIGLAAALIAKKDPDAVMLVFPADHVIRPAAAFRRTAAAAAAAALRSNALFTFGIPPRFAATGYGYIRRGPLDAETKGMPVYRVERFVEKPDRATAERYLSEGGWLWNSGIFCWRAGAILDAIRKFKPGIADRLDAIAKGGKAALAREFPKIEKISIDYAVMEKSPEVRLMEATGWNWDDVGSWLSVADYIRPDGRGNAARGRFRNVDASNCVVLTDGHLVGAVGVRDLIIVHTPDATLVCHRDRAQDVKALVDLLESEGAEDVL